jgi:hypothetical protein
MLAQEPNAEEKNKPLVLDSIQQSVAMLKPMLSETVVNVGSRPMEPACFVPRFLALNARSSLSLRELGRLYSDHNTPLPSPTKSSKEP